MAKSDKGTEKSSQAPGTVKSAEVKETNETRKAVHRETHPKGADETAETPEAPETPETGDVQVTEGSPEPQP